MNLSRKIIKSHLVEGNMTVGSEIAIKVDQTLTQDTLGTMAYLAFETLGIDRVKTEVSVSYADHNMLYIDNKNPDDHTYLYTVAQKFGIHYSRAGNGICHLVQCQRFGIPGKVLTGADSHTPSCGAIGMLGIGSGGMDVAACMAGEPLIIKMPHIINIRLEGKLQPGTSAKDAALFILKKLSIRGGTNKILEYTGSGLTSLTIYERFTLANMGAEAGATSSIFPSDENVLKYLKAQKREKDFVPLAAGEVAEYDGIIEVNLDEIRPLAATPSQPDSVFPVKELKSVKVDQVYIGSCTNSSYADFKKAAAILKGHVVPEHVSLVVAPGSRQIYTMLLKEGVIESFVQSGARILECGCGPCVGMGQAVKTNGVSVRTSNRNYKGRSGTQDDLVYLASPETAAASAVTGYICEAGEIIDVRLLEQITEPDGYDIDDSMIVKPLEDTKDIQIIRGPNIKPAPINEKLENEMELPVVIKVGDNLSTDEIAPTGPMIGALRSNVPAAALTVFSRMDPEFAERVKKLKRSIIVGGENYGQGSSREHAAILPMYLGVKAVIAKSFARIHRTNLINSGLLPLTFISHADYERIDQGDVLVLRDLHNQMQKDEIIIENAAKGIEIKLAVELSDRERKLIFWGGLLNYIKNKNA